ncbi:MAG: hypothetical protein FJW30_01570 [Acidobacteria bacterium]|nr:hypothetical protein [Acidobacteriota bacterium]
MRFLLAVLAAAFPLVATTITKDNSLPHLFQALSIEVNGNTKNVYAGQIGVYFNGSLPALLYCADPSVSLRSGPVSVYAIPEFLYAEGDRLAWLYNTYNATLTEGWQAAALQLAIWEVVVDAGDDLSTGMFRYTGNIDPQIQALANQYLAASAGQSSMGVQFWVPSQGSSYSQTLLGAISASEIVEAPEPRMALPLGASMFALGFYRSHSRRRGTITSCV